MLSAHITSFLKLIDTQLEETSRGVTSSHHFHNVQCGIENILSLLEYSNDVVDRADQLSRRASNYITRHDLISSKIGDRDISEDADRLRATYEALAGFRFAVEHSQPNSRVRTLGLAWKSRLPLRNADVAAAWAAGSAVSSCGVSRRLLAIRRRQGAIAAESVPIDGGSLFKIEHSNWQLTEIPCLLQTDPLPHYEGTGLFWPQWLLTAIDLSRLSAATAVSPGLAGAPWDGLRIAQRE
jgi:hypothetical protein